MWELDLKKAEHQRIDAFELWCWRRLLGVPWTTRRSKQSILKEISPGCSFEGLMLKLKLQYFGHLMRRADSSGKTLMLGKIEGRRRRGWQRIRRLDGITNSMDMGLSRCQQLVIDREAWSAAIHGVTMSWTWLSNWTALNIKKKKNWTCSKDIWYTHWIFNPITMKQRTNGVWAFFSEHLHQNKPSSFWSTFMEEERAPNPTQKPTRKDKMTPPSCIKPRIIPFEEQTTN